MILYATPPANSSQLAYYDDFLRVLIWHEYTHILNIDPIKQNLSVINVIQAK